MTCQAPSTVALAAEDDDHDDEAARCADCGVRLVHVSGLLADRRPLCEACAVKRDFLRGPGGER